MSVTMCLMGCVTSENGLTKECLDTQGSEVEVLSEEDNGLDGINEEPENTKEPTMIHFVDAFGEPYEVELNEAWAKHPYDTTGFVMTEDGMTFTQEGYTTRKGIDVSVYQGNIDWDKVKADGYDFVIMRIGFRGYGSAGNICEDKMFAKHYKGAKAAGLDVGVYFFSQAISEEEAVEEAAFVVKQLESVGATPEELTLPVVFDPESILDAEARTDDVTGEQFTANTIAFCEAIKEAGYQPMTYCNMKWQAYLLDLGQLEEYPLWYADYEPIPQTPYDFVMWQYSESSRVDGVSDPVDTDLWIIPVN